MSDVIRPARMSDLPEIERVVDQAYRGYVARIGRKPAPMLDDYGALIAAGRVQVLESAEIGGVCGILVLIPQADAMLLDNVAIAPQAQGRGYGRRLIACAEQAAIDAGFHLLRLYTNEAMTENIALYAGLGFRQTRLATEHGLRRVYMEKRLD